MIGRTLAHYQVVEKLGEGGMGVVYRARDSNLGRDVAIKILPEAFSRDKDRLARFEREARLVASLNHANIAVIYDFEESDGVHFIVMEYVEGETLQERVSHGRRLRQGSGEPGIPIDEALPLFLQIAEALEAAHNKGIVHRDLKPANIKITPEGKIKVLDFGLAKAVEGEAFEQGLSESPTLTKDVTGTGVLLGTAPYMSPEQARGKPVDKRADIWAFGCVIYEALTGKPAFLGETVSDTLVAVLDREPDWERLPLRTPVLIRSLLRRCLSKEPAHRVHDMADARIEIEEAAKEPAETDTRLPVRSEGSGWRRALPWALVGLMAAIACLAVWAMWQGRSSEPERAVRTSINLPLGQELRSGADPVVDISPDGNRLVYHLASLSGSMYLRDLDRNESIQIRGTEGGVSPFLSPDGNWVVFRAGTKLRKVRLDGVGSVDLCDTQTLRGGSWRSDNALVFATYSGLMQVSAEGGTPQVLTRVDPEKGELCHYWPDVLPDGKTVIYSIVTSGNYDDATIVVQSLVTGERRRLVNAGCARYVPTGHLVYVRGGTLYAAPFDMDRLEVTGSGIPVQTGIASARGGPGCAQFTFSETGTLIYVAGATPARRLVRVDLNGKAEVLPAPLLPYWRVRFSPDGRQLALAVESSSDQLNEIHLYELTTGRLSRLTPRFDGPSFIGNGIAWSPDGKSLAVNATMPGSFWLLFLIASDGSGVAEQLTRGLGYQFPDAWSVDGKHLLYTDQDNSTHWDIWELLFEPGHPPRPLLKTPDRQAQPILSPDGRWLAYTSRESGQFEVYVTPYPGCSGRHQISENGGGSPVWSSDGREIYYRNLEGDKMMAVRFRDEPELAVSKPRLLFEGQYYTRVPSNPRTYDISPDGRSFVMIQDVEERRITQFQVVLNWFDELERLVPTEN